MASGTGRFRIQKLMRQRFGIAAPRVEIQTRIPWYWRWVGIAVLISVAAGAAGWFYDAGRRFAGFDHNEVQEELRLTRTRLDAANSELEKLRGQAAAADNRLAIERTAQQKLAQQIRVLEQENMRVREELATFESMLTSEARNVNALSIYRFKVEPDVLPGEYRYRLLILTPSTRRDRDFNGRLELVVNLTEGGQSAMMSFPEQSEAGAAAFKLNFRYFRRVEGTFRVSPGAKVQSVQARIYESGSPEPRATNSVSL